MTIRTVGTGQQFSTIGAAVAASQDGDVIAVQAGTYVNDFATINTKITLQGVGGMVHVLATVPPPDGKAIFTVNTDATFDHFEFSGVQVADMNGAGIRHQAGNLTVLNSYFHDNQTGILTNYVPTATLTIRNSEFARNSAADGWSHGIYVGSIAKLTIDNSYFHDSAVGHQIKSRAAETVITNSRIADYGSTASYSVDVPNGGRVVLSNNTIEQGPNSQNPTIVAFGEEGNLHSNSSIEMRGNTVVNNLPGGLLLWNAAGTAATLADTKVFGLASNQLAAGPVSITGTIVLASAPALDATPPWAGSPSVNHAPAAPAGQAVATSEDTATAPVAIGASDQDGDALTYALKAGMAPALGTVRFDQAAGTFTYTPDPDATGADAFTIRITDPSGAVAEQAVAVTINPGAGGGSWVGTVGADSKAGGAGSDTLDGAAGADRLAGNGGNDWILGRTGKDLLTGGAGRDVLEGGGGADTLDGETGADSIAGGNGADVLTGGAGADRFAWLSMAERGDRVTDFDAAAGDRLDLSAILGGNGHDHASLAAGGFIKLAQRTDGVAVRVDADGSGDGYLLLVTLNGASIADLGTDYLLV